MGRPPAFPPWGPLTPGGPTDAPVRRTLKPQMRAMSPNLPLKAGRVRSGRQRVRVGRWVGPVSRWARCERVDAVGREASCSVVFVVRAWNVVRRVARVLGAW